MNRALLPVLGRTKIHTQSEKPNKLSMIAFFKVASTRSILFWVAIGNSFKVSGTFELGL